MSPKIETEAERADRLAEAERLKGQAVVALDYAVEHLNNARRLITLARSVEEAEVVYSS